VKKSLGDLGFSGTPITIAADALLYDAMALFEKSHVDTIVVVENDKPVGIVDIQDIVSRDLFGG
jgi:CBS domain-containing protein